MTAPTSERQRVTARSRPRARPRCRRRARRSRPWSAPPGRSSAGDCRAFAQRTRARARASGLLLRVTSRSAPGLVIGVPPRAALRSDRRGSIWMARGRSHHPGEARCRSGGGFPEPPAMIRHRPRTRGVAAQHASLSRWRSPVRIRSGPPSLFDSSHAPSARPDGAFLCPPTALTGPVRYPAARDRPRSRLHPEGAEAPRGTPVVARPRGRHRARHRRRGGLRRRRARRLRRPAGCVTDAGPGRRGVDRHAGRPDRVAGPGSAGQRGARVRGTVGIGGACRARRVGRRRSSRSRTSGRVGPPRGRRTCGPSRAATARTPASRSWRRTPTRSSRRSA